MKWPSELEGYQGHKRLKISFCSFYTLMKLTIIGCEDKYLNSKFKNASFLDFLLVICNHFWAYSKLMLMILYQKKFMDKYCPS